MMKLFYNAWEKTCSDFDNEQTFKLNIITFGFEVHLASKNLMDLVGEEMLIFRNQLLKSTVIATIKEPHLKILKPEGVRYNPRKGEAPMDEGCELFNVDDGSLEEDEESIVVITYQVQKLLKQLIKMLMMTYPLLFQIPMMKY